VNRAQRRAAAKRRLREGVAHISQQGQGLCGLHFIKPEQLPDLIVQSFLGDDDCFGTVRALVHTATHIRHADPPALCLTCPREIRDASQVGLYTVLRPEVEKPELGLGSAICHRCCARHDLTDMVNDAYRRIWPEFRPLTVSPAPEMVQ
jgi:hypothetical protein